MWSPIFTTSWPMSGHHSRPMVTMSARSICTSCTCIWRQKLQIPSTNHFLSGLGNLPSSWTSPRWLLLFLFCCGFYDIIGPGLLLRYGNALWLKGLPCLSLCETGPGTGLEGCHICLSMEQSLEQGLGSVFHNHMVSYKRFLIWVQAERKKFKKKKKHSLKN